MLRAADCVVVITRHASLDVDMLIEHSRVVVDNVNATGSSEATGARIVRLGTSSGDGGLPPR